MLTQKEWAEGLQAEIAATVQERKQKSLNALIQLGVDVDKHTQGGNELLVHFDAEKEESGKEPSAREHYGKEHTFTEVPYQDESGRTRIALFGKKITTPAP